MKKIVAFIAAFAMVITTFGFSAPALSQASAAEKMITGVAPDGAKVAVDWNVRYPYADLQKQFQDLNAAYPQYSELESIGKTYQDRDMMCMTITDEAIPAAKKTEVTVFGNIHGGEGESAACAMYSAWYLLENSGTTQVQDLLKKYIVYVIPVINPDGYEQSFLYRTRENANPAYGDKDGDGIPYNDNYADINGDGLIGTVSPLDMETGTVPTQGSGWRVGTATFGVESPDSNKNGVLGDEPFNSGVDLNRNFDFMWGQDGRMDTEGPSAASELETQAVQKFVDTHRNMKGLITLHTGIQTTLYPWGYRAINEDDPEEVADIDFMKETAIAMSTAISKATQRNFYAKQSFYDYQTYSELIDYAYGKYGIHSYTIEVYSPGSFEEEGMSSKYDPDFEVYDPNGPDSIVPNLCCWNDPLPEPTYVDYNHEEAVALLQAAGIDPAKLAYSFKTPWGMTLPGEVTAWGEDQGIRISYNSENLMRGKAPQDQDVMVTGVMDGILTMFYSENPDPGTYALEAAAYDIMSAVTTLGAGEYTSESYEALMEAVNELNALYDLPTVTSGEVAAAQAKLVAAWRTLEPVNVAAQKKKEAFNNAIDGLLETLIKVYALDLSSYKDASVDALWAETAVAEALLVDEDVTIDQLRAAKTDVLTAWKSLDKKEAQAVTVKANNKKTVSAKKLKKANQKVKGTVAVTGNAVPATFKKAGGDKKLTVAKNGTITVKKGAKKGKHKVKVTVSVPGDGDYLPFNKTVSVTITVK